MLDRACCLSFGDERFGEWGVKACERAGRAVVLGWRRLLVWGKELYGSYESCVRRRSSWINRRDRRWCGGLVG